MNHRSATIVSGTFYRIVFARDFVRATDGSGREAGRFHHDGQPALYLSPCKASAARAVAPYVRADDPARLVVELCLTKAQVVDLRDRAVCATLGLDPTDGAIPWLPVLAEGGVPPSWSVADAVRRSGADGLIYPSRSAVRRWHVVLFRWCAAVVGSAPMPMRPPRDRSSA